MTDPNKHSITALIVDDEREVRSLLRNILQQNFNSVDVVGEAANIPEAVREIHKHKPNLVFLDIEMPGYSGLQLLEFFDATEATFDIIFVTAFNEYAIQAFKISAFDYLLKPVNVHDLTQTLQRYTGKQQKQKLVERVNLLRESLANDELPSQIAVSSLQGIDFIELEKVVSFEASGTYTKIILVDGDPILSSKPLGEFELLLQNNPKFFRPHRSFLINMKYVRKVSSKEGDIIYLSNSLEIPLSRYRKKEFDKIITAYKI